MRGTPIWKPPSCPSALQHGHPWHIAPVALFVFARAAAELTLQQQQHQQPASEGAATGAAAVPGDPPLGSIPGLDEAWIMRQASRG